MPETLTLILQFSALAAAVVVAGTYLARYGDAIGERTSIGGLWIGTVLVAAATSLPELVTDITAVRIGAVDLALGDLFGSSMANMLILAVLDLGYPRLRLVSQAAHDNLLSAALAIILTAIAILGLLLRAPNSVFGIGAAPAVILVVYLVGNRTVYLRSTNASENHAARPRAETPTLRRAVLAFAAAAALILLAAPFFARTAERLAELSGLGSTFVGTWLVGISTSLPEFVVCLAAVRMRAFDLAIGNLFGSNAFNMTILVALDITNGGAPLLAAVDPAHAITALVAIIMMAVSIAAILFRTDRSYSLLEPSSAVIVLTYVAGLAIIYLRAVHSAGT